jgi:hypothetical protein
MYGIHFMYIIFYPKFQVIEGLNNEESILPPYHISLPIYILSNK